MTWRHIFTESIAALRFHRQRSIFTTLSLGWGVTCFVILISYGDGFERALVKAFTAVGQNLVLTMSGQTSEQAGGLRSGRRIRLEYADANIVKEAVPLVDKLSPEIMKNGVKAQHAGREKEVSIRAVWPEYDIVRNVKIVEGRWLNEDDRQHQYRVVILGAKVAKDLFGGAPAVDEDVILNGIHFTVIGVMDNKLQIANYNRSDNQCVFIPYESFGVFGDTKYPWFLVWKPVLGADQQRAIQMVRAKLAELHRFSPTDEKAVEILAFAKFMTIITGMSLAVKLLLGFVGALTLAIGGVGLANIMLASVIDRTREIGMIKALGGKRSMILKQFLVEACLIVSMGGALGIGLGVVGTQLIGSMPFLGPAFKDTTGTGDIYLSVSPMSVLVSTGVLLVVGLVAGLVPAVKASRLDPIEALHYEQRARYTGAYVRFFEGVFSTPRWLALWAAQLGFMLDAMDVLLYVFALTTLKAEFGWTNAQAGLVSSVTLIASAFGGIAAGIISDKIGRRRTLIYTILLYSLASAGTATSRGIWDLIFWRALVGLGLGGEWSAGATLVAESWPAEHRAKAVSFMQSGWALGYMAAAALAALILPTLGWRALFLAGVLPALVTVFIRRKVQEPEIWLKATHRASFTGIFKAPYARRTFWATVLATSVLFAYWGLFTWLPGFLSAPVSQGGAGMSIVKTSGFVFAVQIGAFYGYICFGYLADWLGRRPAFAMYVAAAALLTPVYGLAPTISPVLLLMLGPCIGFFGTGFFSLFGAMLAELYPTAIRGAGQGFVYNFGRGLSALAPYAVGSLADSYGLGAALGLNAAFFLMAAGLVFLLPETKSTQLESV